MSELKSNFVAVELSETELDVVAGGLSVTIDDANGFAQSSANDFVQKNMTVAQQTFAGPQGSGTASVFNFQINGSSAGQSLAIG